MATFTRLAISSPVQFNSPIFIKKIAIQTPVFLGEYIPPFTVTKLPCQNYCNNFYEYKGF